MPVDNNGNQQAGEHAQTRKTKVRCSVSPPPAQALHPCERLAHVLASHNGFWYVTANYRQQ
eukprot:scaffold951_cov146-Amphora_coffeaeformis.AAC.6